MTAIERRLLHRLSLPPARDLTHLHFREREGMRGTESNLQESPVTLIYLALIEHGNGVLRHDSADRFCVAIDSRPAVES